MVNSNSATASANKNNQAQQQGQIENTQAANAQATASLAPWLTKAATPFGNATPGPAPGPLSLGAIPGQAQAAMQPPQQAQPAQAQPQPQRRAPQGQIGQPGAMPKPPSPEQLSALASIMHGPQTLNTAPVTL